MRKKLYIALGLAVFALLVSGVYKAKERVDLRKLDAAYDKRMQTYVAEERVARKYLEIVRIRDEETYQDVRNVLYSHLSGNLQKELFGSKSYGLPERAETSYKILGVSGEYEKEGQTREFMVTYEVESAGYSKVLTNLILVENGKITKVEKL